MSEPRYDVIGLGNAIVDVIAETDDSFLARHGIAKGGMTLIDAFRAKQLEDAISESVIVPGGSAANTIAGVASLAARRIYRPGQRRLSGRRLRRRNARHRCRL